MCRHDLYSFSFDLKRDWTRKFADQPEILSYFEGLADRFDLRRCIRFGTEVVSLDFDEARAEWSTRLDDGSLITSNVVVCAVGQLSRPAVPDLPGRSEFSGPKFHSAEWDHEVELAGRRVAIVGNGASAVQFVPHVVALAEQVTLFQRSANWVMPKPDRAYTARERSILERVPGAARMLRWYIYWRLELNFALMRRGNPLSRLLARVAGRKLTPLATPTLPVEALVPDYLPGCKRILISNDYYPALRADHVVVELDPIDRVDADAVVTRSGTRHPADVIIFGTGFAATDFLTPMAVHGRGGRELSATWQRGAEAHLGIEVAGFPNLFIMYGPNTNLGHNSILFMIEAQARYVRRAVRHLLDHDLASVEVRPDVMSRCNESLRAATARTIWATECTSWYKTAEGVVTNNWPLPSIAYWWRTRAFRAGDHVVTPWPLVDRAA